MLEKEEDGMEAMISAPNLDRRFTMTGVWKEWGIILKADQIYYPCEIRAPAGYILTYVIYQKYMNSIPLYRQNADWNG